MKKTVKKATPRHPLTRARVLAKAIKLADQGGLAGLSMRRLAANLKVEAMSLYHHFKNKEEILDSMVDAVFEKVDWQPNLELSWQQQMAARANAMREVLNVHPWAIGLLESRKNPGPATLAHLDNVLGCLLDAGFSYGLAAHAYALLDSFIYGFAVQEHSLPTESDADMQTLAEEIVKALPQNLYPHITTMTHHYFSKPSYSFAKEFSFGLELLLEGLEAKRASEM